LPPKVSILLAVHNGEAFLDQAVTSLQAQELRDWELLAVDDRSEDGSWAKLEGLAAAEPRLRLWRNPANLGLAGSLARLLPEARGEYVARQDDDDIYLPEKLARQAAFLDRRPEVALAGTFYGTITPGGEPLEPVREMPVSDAGIRRLAVLSQPFCGVTVMMRRAVLARHGLNYDPAKLHAEDFDLYSRLLARGRAANLPQVLMLVRKRPGSVSVRHLAAQEDLADAIAQGNLAAAGLQGVLTRREVALLRYGVGGRDPGLGPADHAAQVRAAARLAAACRGLPRGDREVILGRLALGLAAGWRARERRAGAARAAAELCRRAPAAAVSLAWRLALARWGRRLRRRGKDGGSS
jgi:hypothetical protein